MPGKRSATPRSARPWPWPRERKAATCALLRPTRRSFASRPAYHLIHDTVARATHCGLARHVRRPAPPHADGRQDTSRADAEAEPVVERPALLDGAGVDH